MRGILARPNNPMKNSQIIKIWGSHRGYRFERTPPANAPMPSPNIKMETITVTDSMFTPNVAKSTRYQTT
jgi:hypothetical protein